MTNNNMYFIANWKMFGSVKSVNSLNKVISYSKTKKLKANIIYCPPYTLIKSFVDKTKKSNIKIGAQDCHTQINYGPFTGAISSKMIKDLGGEFVIIGHSETRAENDNKKINLKIKSALNEKLNVILCIGEKLIDKRKNKTKYVLKKQLLEGLKNLKNLNKVIIAYEPVWSIATDATLFIICSLGLTIISRGDLPSNTSVIDKIEENADDAPKLPENNN